MKDKKSSSCQVRAVIQVKPGRTDEFVRLMGELTKVLEREFGVTLARTYLVKGKPGTFVNLWSIPSQKVLKRFTTETPDPKLVQRLEACIESEQVEEVSSVFPAGEDNTLLIATDNGTIYRLVEERWKLPEFKLEGDAAEFLKENLLDNGVITAHLPFTLIDPFFFCYLINLDMIKDAPAQTLNPEPEPEPEPEPTEKSRNRRKQNGGKTRPGEGKQRSGRRRRGS